MATLNLFVKLQFRFFGQGPTLNETTNETVTSFYFKVSILHYGQTNPDIFETTYFLTRIGLASTRNQWIRSQKPPLSRAVKDPVRVHTSLWESSSNACLWWGALRDDTKNRCVRHYVHMNPEKLCRFKNGQIRVNMALTEVGGVPLKRTGGDTSGFPLYPAGSECGGALWIVVPLCRKDLWKEAVAHFKYRRLDRQHPGPTHKYESFITHDLICIWSFFSVLTIFIDFFFFEKLVIQMVERGRKIERTQIGRSGESSSSQSPSFYLVFVYTLPCERLETNWCWILLFVELHSDCERTVCNFST